MNLNLTKTIERSALWLFYIAVVEIHLLWAFYEMYQTIDHEIVKVTYALAAGCVAVVLLTIALRVEFYDT